jgi:hypothetical protein
VEEGQEGTASWESFLASLLSKGAAALPDSVRSWNPCFVSNPHSCAHYICLRHLNPCHSDTSIPLPHWHLHCFVVVTSGPLLSHWHLHPPATVTPVSPQQEPSCLCAETHAAPTADTFKWPTLHTDPVHLRQDRKTAGLSLLPGNRIPIFWKIIGNKNWFWEFYNISCDTLFFKGGFKTKVRLAKLQFNSLGKATLWLTCIREVIFVIILRFKSISSLTGKYN